MRKILSRKATEKGGFTFLEIILVVAIIALVTSISTPVVYNFVRSSLTQAANQFVSIVNDLKIKSILGNRYLTLVIDPDENVYQILEQDTASGKWTPIEEFKEPIAIVEDVQIKEIDKGLKQITNEKVRVHFQPSGLVELLDIIFYLNDEQITVSVKDVFGTIETSEEEPLQGFVL